MKKPAGYLRACTWCRDYALAHIRRPAIPPLLEHT
jgi:hypothetical protein